MVRVVVPHRHATVLSTAAYGMRRLTRCSSAAGRRRRLCTSAVSRRHCHASAAHAHRYLSAAEVVGAQAAAGTSAAGISVTLPPLCAWGACVDADDASEVGLPRSHRDSNRFAALWAPVLSYVAHLSGGSAAVACASTPLSPPLCLVLRLFPDLTVAQLPSVHRGGSTTSSPCAPHEYPLDAILGAAEVWGSGTDSQQVFRNAIAGLHEMGQRLLPQVPLVLQLPTRLLVSQQFLHDVATLLVRDGWRSVSFELPSTHQLYSSSSSGGGGGGGGGSACRRRDVEDTVVDSTWCRLPLLCTPWQTLCRHPGLGHTLRQLRRHDVVPFHVLYAWAVAEMQLFNGLERSLVVDTTAPMPGEEAARQAHLQGRDTVGQSAGEMERAVPPAGLDRAASECWAEARREVDGAGSTDVRVCMADNPLTTRAAGAHFSSDVVDAVRQRGRATGGGAAAAAAAAAAAGVPRPADLDVVEREWRRRRQPEVATPSATAASAQPSRSSPGRPASAPSLVLDTPPDHLRALIEGSILRDDGDGTTPTAVTPQRRLLQKVGQFMQRTMSDDAAAPADAEASTSTDDSGASLAQQAEELERLLREANEARNTSSSAVSGVEHMMTEMHRYMRAHAQPPAPTVESPTSPAHTAAMHAAPCAESGPSPNAWSACAGYWSCIHALTQGTAGAALLWTAPTFHAAAVRAWTAAYHASQTASGSRRLGETSRPRPPLLPPPVAVVPVYMPVQSAMRVEVERLLREGRQFARPPLCAGDAEAERPLHTWLPASLNAALADALTALPRGYEARERRRLLRDHQRLRRGGAQAARRPASVVESVAALPVTGDAESDTDVVRIRVKHEALPLFLLSPAQVQRREAQASADALAAASEARVDEGRVRTVNESLAQAVESGYRAAAASRDGGAGVWPPPLTMMHVPTPGLSAVELHRSWHCLHLDNAATCAVESGERRERR
ncbi:hypothetical protein NESM_000392000 [Novymonas esmeraldas]|uniref:Uncharacterized protein n=1 Tax=Novymonas esmeraldas TaxID=1808958 RepID=A0AAW0EKT0_9TRYP